MKLICILYVDNSRQAPDTFRNHLKILCFSFGIICILLIWHVFHWALLAIAEPIFFRTTADQSFLISSIRTIRRTNVCKLTEFYLTNVCKMRLYIYFMPKVFIFVFLLIYEPVNYLIMHSSSMNIHEYYFMNIKFVLQYNF